MNEGRARRKLSGILSADAVGYSRLMQEDEAATIRTLEESKELMSRLIQQYHGRVVDAPGDNLLAEFSSVVDATECAVNIQLKLKAKNADLPKNRQMAFRIGINLGDVVEEADRIYGDGINIAARIEGLAEPGGICISRTAYDQIKHKLKLGFEYLGEHRVKNIPEPVRVYRISMEPEDAGKVIGEKRFAKKKLRTAALAAVIVIVIATGSLAGWYLYLHRSASIEPASVDRMELTLPDKPSIAVLPFTNMGDDPQQEYFSDGMTDDLITDLSKISGLFVISRNSTFTYKGKPVKIRQVAQELNVRYVLEGSVRRAGEQVRINAQLIEAATGHHLWAERYDGQIIDVFALQDKITQKIVTALAVTLTTAEEVQVAHQETSSVDAYDSFLQGWAHYVRVTPGDYAKAVSYFEKAVELDPQYGQANAALASIYWESFYRFWHSSLGISWRESLGRAEKYLQKAMKNPTPLCYLVASKMLIGSFEHEKATEKAEQAIALDPNDSNSYIAMAYTLIYSGRPDEALGFIQKAIRLDPHFPAYYLFVIGLAHFGVDRFEEAVSSFERALKRNPENYVPLIPLAAAYAHLNRQQDATATIEKLKRVLPMVTLSFVRKCPLWKYKNPADKGRLLEGLKKSGLPDSIYEILRKAG
jgi:TolB-like protein/class 3 adenylate cyclase